MSGRKFIVFEDDITKESTQELVNEIDLSLGNATLFFSSSGGIAYCGDIIIEKLNSYPGIDIVFTHEACSAGFDLILKCRNKKTLGNYFSYGMMHKTEIYAGVENAFHKGTRANIISEDMDRIRNQDRWYANKIMTKFQLKKFESNQEVYLNRDQVQAAIDMNIACIDTKTQ